jgi:hypothetical protein
MAKKEERYARDMVARAFGWRDWKAVEEASQRDGYTEAGGRGALAAAIGKEATEAGHLVEHVERFGPEANKVYEEPKLDVRHVPGDRY